jgi:hypothetical protein
VLPDDDHRSKHVGAFKCFNVCFRIIQYILVHLLVLIISEGYRMFIATRNMDNNDHFSQFLCTMYR